MIPHLRWTGVARFWRASIRPLPESFMKLSYWVTATLVTASLAGLQAAALTATTTTVSAAPNPVVIGSVVTYTVKVVGSGAPLTGETELTANGRHIAALTLTNGVST